MQNIGSFHLFILEIQSISESHDQTEHAHFWPCSLKKFFDHSLIYVNFYQRPKNQATLLI